MSIIRFVAFTLGYTNPRKAIWDHTKGGTNRSPLIAGGNQEMTFVPEGDVYRLVAHSRLPSVERFERRGFGDVLPSIRKTGMYALLAIYVDKVAKLIEQTGMKNTPSVLSDSAQRRTSLVQWQRKHSNAEIMNSGLDGRQKDQSYICRRQSPNRIPHRLQPCGSLPSVETTVFFSIPQN